MDNSFALVREPLKKNRKAEFENNERAKQGVLFSTGAGELKGQGLLFGGDVAFQGDRDAEQA